MWTGSSFSPRRSSWRRSAPRPPTSWCGGRKGFNRRGGRGGQGDHRRLRAEDRQAGRARLASARGAGGRARGGARGRASRPTSLFTASRSQPLRRNGPTRVGSSTSRTRSATSRTCSTRTRSSAPPCSTRRPAGAASTCCRWACATNHVHVWKSLLERAGFTLADIPKEWEPFWSFWCDQVQPAVRKALGRDDIWGIGLPMSVDAVDTRERVLAVRRRLRGRLRDPDGRLVIDDPEVRRRLIKAIDSYTAIYRKGCTPPDSVDWDSYGNNEHSWRRRS